MNKKKYWDIKMKNDNEVDLYIHNEISSWGDGEYATSAKSFKEDLDSFKDVKVLNIYINSPGGEVFEGICIYNMLKRHSAHKKVYVDGLAASIASVIAMCGDKIIMPSNSMLMIHNASNFAWGNSSELRKQADDLEKITNTIKQIYLEKTDKIDEHELTSLMDNETWLSANECLDIGLCSEVIKSNSTAANIDSESLKNFKNVPEAFFNVKKEIGMDKDTKMLIEEIRNL